MYDSIIFQVDKHTPQLTFPTLLDLHVDRLASHLVDEIALFIFQNYERIFRPLLGTQLSPK